MPPIPTGVFNVGFDLKTASDGVIGGAYNLGYNQYTLLAYCPSLSIFGGTGVAGQYPVT